MGYFYGVTSIGNLSHLTGSKLVAAWNMFCVKGNDPINLSLRVFQALHKAVLYTNHPIHFCIEFFAESFCCTEHNNFDLSIVNSIPGFRCQLQAFYGQILQFFHLKEDSFVALWGFIGLLHTALDFTEYNVRQYLNEKIKSRILEWRETEWSEDYPSSEREIFDTTESFMSDEFPSRFAKKAFCCSNSLPQSHLKQVFSLESVHAQSSRWNVRSLFSFETTFPGTYVVQCNAKKSVSNVVNRMSGTSNRLEVHKVELVSSIF